MEFCHQPSGLYVTNEMDEETAFRSTTHLGIGAHADDLEFMAFSGIAECYESKVNWFSGITVTNGSSSPSSEGVKPKPDELAMIRYQEQEEAAKLGKYAFQAQFGYSSKEVLKSRESLVKDLYEILDKVRPQYLYLHQPFDKHPTHVAVFRASVDAVRMLARENRPVQVFGCEVWRGLDWLPEKYKIAMNTSAHQALASALHNCFQSQIKGGKRYELAVPGRWLSNATFAQSHEIDQFNKVAWALELTDFVNGEENDLRGFCDEVLTTFRNEIISM